MVNSSLKGQTNDKKLQFGVSKCKKIHIGKSYEEYKCQPLFVDGWKEVEKKNEETGILEIEDVYIGEEVMEDKEEEKYLGDIISKDGRNLKKIKARVDNE